MSQTTTTPLKAAPAATSGVSLAGASGWANSTWTEVLASSGGPVAIAGLVAAPGAGEIDVGTGAAGSEVVVTTFRISTASTGSYSGPYIVWLPTPVTGIGSGARIALRQRGTAGLSGVSLLYYENLDATNSSALPTKPLPSAADAVSITPNGTAWANSAYTQLTAGLGTAISLLGFCFSQPVANIEGEWDLATGAAGAEVVITTLRFAAPANPNVGGVTNILLPAPYPIAASTRIAVRLRKSGTSTTTFFAAVFYDESTPASTTPTRLSQLPVEVLRGPQPLPPARLSQLPVEILRGGQPLPKFRLSQLPIEILRAPGRAETVSARLSQLPIEVLRLVPTKARLSQLPLEALLRLPPPPTRLSQLPLELLIRPPQVPLRATQLAVETLSALPPAPVAATQVAAEFLSQLQWWTEVSQVACELLVIPRTGVGCPPVTDFPIDPAAGSACASAFPIDSDTE